MSETARYLREEEIAELSRHLRSFLPAGVRRLLLLALAYEPSRDSAPPTAPHGDEKESLAPGATTAGEPAFQNGKAANTSAGGAPHEEAGSRLVVDARTRQAYYRGRVLDLPPRAFQLLALLASRPGQVVPKDEICDHLWPEGRSGTDDERPYERQIADHKRKLVRKLRALAGSVPGLSQEEVNGLILTKPRRGYLLNLTAREVMILPRSRKGI